MPAAAANMLDRNIRVQYYSDDVTVRYFTPQSPPQRVPDRNIRVRYYSDDVTVRYFLPKLVVALPFDSEWKPRAVTEPQGRVIDFD